VTARPSEPAGSRPGPPAPGLPLAAAFILCLSLAPRAAHGQEGWRLKGTTLSRGRFEISPTGYVQGDFRSFRDWNAGDEDTGILRSDERELRRLRLGFAGKWSRLAFQLSVELRDDALELLDEDEERTFDRLKDAYLELRLHKGLRLRGGHFKLPVSGEFLTSAAKTDFEERALLATHIGPDRDVGLMAHGEPLRWLSYQVGVFKGDGRTRHDRSRTTGAGRLVFEPVGDFDLGISYSQADVEPDPDGPGLEPKPKGILGEGPSGFEFYERHFVSGRRRRLGAEAAFTPGPVALRAEVLQGREERKGQGSTFEDLPEQVATGWKVSLTWLVVGQRKSGDVKPRRSLFRGPGAVELGARLERLHFDDDGPDTGFAGAGNRARNIRPAADRIVTGGLSWWPAGWLRLMGNVIVERYLDPLLAPEIGRPGNYVTVLGRVQLQLP